MNIEKLMSAKYVRIGRILIHGRDVEKRLSWFMKPLVVNTHNASFPYSIRGTACTIKIDDRYFLFFCRHQIRDVGPEDIVFPARLGNGATFVGGGIHTFIEADPSNSEEEYPDICCFEIDPSKCSIGNFESEFFDAQEADCWPQKSLGQLFLFGYPSQDQRYDLDETETALAHLGISCVVTGGEYAGASNARWTHALRMQRTRAFDADGLSGGAVFQIGEDENGFFVGLAGIVVRGSQSSDLVHFIDTRALIQYSKRR